MGRVMMSGIVPKLVAPVGLPSAVTSLNVAGSDYTATISWTNPTESTFYESVVVQKVGSRPISITDGEEVYRGSDTEVTVENLGNGTYYYWAVFALDAKGRYREGFPYTFYKTPTEYELIETLNESVTWTAPEDAWYRIELQGASGNGGKGSYHNYDYGEGSVGAGTALSSGGSGGGSGCAISRVKLKKDDTIVYTHATTGNTCKAVINSSVEDYTALQVTSGANGTDGDATLTNSAGSGGSGGSASGGQENYSGGRGSNGKYYDAEKNYNVTCNGGVGGDAGYTGGCTGGAGGNAGVKSGGTPYYDAGSSGKAAFMQIYKGEPLIPAVPTEWQFLEAIASDTEWTPPATNEWYRVWAIGQSGSGGDGEDGNSGDVGGNGGAGGNSGGLAGSVLLGSDIGTVSCIVNSSQTSFGTFLRAYAGGSANGTSVSSTVGSASGGNLYNLSGYQGGAGGTPGIPESYWEDDQFLHYTVSAATSGQRGGNKGQLGGAGGDSWGDTSSSTYTSGGGGEGGGARLPSPYDGFPYIPDEITLSAQNAAAYPALDLTAPVLYGGGAGGQGGQATGGYHEESWSSGSNGAAGSPGLIIIEKGVA